ncbi:hypothetical protein OQA88_7818 [Cercophora sp. LCS_1]
MDALKHLISNIPDWLKRLEELNGQIEKRQIELAALTESQSEKSSGPKSMRNKGSTESLRPKDEDEARRARDPTPQPVGEQQPTPSSPADSHSPSALARQTNQARAAGQARARATLRRRQRSDSVISAEGAAPKYRTRSMIIVYYDSYVQLFFEDLVKFVSASRNMMRKAKMAAKVAQIKRLAELEMPDDDEEAEENSNDSPKVDANAPITPIEAANDRETEDLPGARWVSARRMQSPGMLMAQAALGRSMYSRAGAAGRVGFGRGLGGLEPLEKDIYDDLDKGLEYVQSMCEHAAHQFLRDGDCGEEVNNIAKKMAETKVLADKEFERVQREEPEALKAEEDQMRVRSYRPPSMRKDLGTSSPRAEASKETLKEAAKTNASATNIIEVDEGIEVDNTLKAKGTRMMT